MAKICGAITRSGEVCKNAPLQGNMHCQWHLQKSEQLGQAVPKRRGAQPGNAYAWVHGMYGDLIRNDDLPFVDDIRSRVGAVEEELLVARLQLRRALRAQARADELPDGMEVAETVERDGSEKTAGRSEVKKKLRDYPAIINTMLGRIESLEKTRLDLLKAEKAIQAAQAAAATQTETQNLVITVRRAGAGDDGV